MHCSYRMIANCAKLHLSKLDIPSVCSVTYAMHRGMCCQFPFQWIYYYGSNESTRKELEERNSVQ